MIDSTSRAVRFIAQSGQGDPQHRSPQVDRARGHQCHPHEMEMAEDWGCALKRYWKHRHSGSSMEPKRVRETAMLKSC